METCGFIMNQSGDFESNFLMRCSYCKFDIELPRWHEFVLHFRKMHCSEDTAGFVDTGKILANDSCAIDQDAINYPEALFVLDDSVKDKEIKLELNSVQSDAGDSGSSSSLSNASLSGVETPETETETNAQSGKADRELVSNQSTYKFSPSFFRRDSRTITFIKSYKNQTCLWNTGHSSYKEAAARKAAYQQMIKEMEVKAGVIFTEHSLKTAIRKLHLQFNTIAKRVADGSQKSNSVAFNHFTTCGFLREFKDPLPSYYKTGNIQLNFSKKNKLTTDFINLYVDFPQLYDNKHSNFSNMISRKQAYLAMTEKTSVTDFDVNVDDVYLAIQSLRQWFYKSTKHTINTVNESEKFYLQACAFLPPKMFKQRLICEICQQETSSDHVLQTHMYKTHNIGELPFKCSSCERSFVGRGDLTTHMQRVHIGKTYKCNYCDRAFAVNSDLRLHIRTHTGNKILCELCGKAFRLRSQLTLHMTAIHTKIRAHKCTMCPKDFLKKVHLTDHIKSHLNIRDKICITCGKGFTSSHSLIRHRQIHSEVKKFVCKLCDARFSQFVGLNSHLKRTHNIIRNNVQKEKTNIITEQSVN